MKRRIVSVVYILSLLTYFSVNAQPSLDMGKVVLTIQPEQPNDLAAPAGTFTFSMENGSPLAFSEASDEGYSDFGFSGDAVTGDKSFFLTMNIRITPSGTGTFVFSNKNEDPKKNARITLNVDNNVILIGKQGQVIVTSYPKKNGDFLVGTFSGILTDNGNEVESLPTHLYKVSGSFKIKKIE
ncbi:MAG: hypothetical protein IRZ01_11420 [Thermoflavifilum aggregans]|nr:hypothetical protein [Thermoflavifilum aggregans]